MQMESWNELANPRDLTKIFQTPEYAAWRSLRESEDSRYIGLCMPRFLARLPYGAKTEPVEEFALRGRHRRRGQQQVTAWSNAAYAMATNITRAFKLYGWTLAASAASKAAARSRACRPSPSRPTMAAWR